MQRFHRIMYAQKQLRVLDEVPDAEMREAITSTWPDINVDQLTSKDLAGKARLQEILRTHYRVRTYSFQVSNILQICVCVCVLLVYAYSFLYVTVMT